jgi:transmembrane sensor
MIRSGSLAEIQKEAAAWLVEMDVNPDGWDRAGFLAWLKLSPRHMEEYLEQHALWVAFHETEPGDIDVTQLRNDPGNVIHWPRGKEHQEQGRTIVKHPRGWLGTLVATAAVLVCAAVLWGVLLGQNQTLSTAVGEQRAVRLPDGSTLHLNTDTRVEIRFTDTAREVRLRKGEAMFTVERDVNRPFRVTADGVGFEALGTQFNVRRRASGTTISVVEGRVAVIADLSSSSDNSGRNHVSTLEDEANVATPPRLPPVTPYESGRPPPAGALAVVAAGEQVRVSVDGSLKEEAIENVTAWRQRQLIFSNTPLSEVAAEVARYNVTPRLIIEGEDLQARPLNGVFAADDPESLLQFLRHEGLSVTRRGDTVFIRSVHEGVRNTFEPA